jgi:hypothetical protein
MLLLAVPRSSGSAQGRSKTAFAALRHTLHFGQQVLLDAMHLQVRRRRISTMLLCKAVAV